MQQRRYKDKTISVISVDNSHQITNWGVKNSFIGSILDDIGLQRPKAQNDIKSDRMSISEERLDIIDADILFIQVLDGSNREPLEKLQQRPIWTTLKAVQQERIYPVDMLTWVGSNLLAADAVIDDLYKYLVNPP